MSHDPSQTRTQEQAHFEALQYGMFLHFGLATFSQDEYAERQADLDQYAPTDLDPKQWIGVAKQAGMKYAVLTARHQQGHCLWPSKFTSFGVQSNQVNRDVVREFVDACREEGIEPGLYYLLGWELKHQSVMTPEAYADFLERQIEELLQEYGPLLVLWLDIPFDLGPDSTRVLHRLYNTVKTIQSSCLVMLNCSEWEGTSIRMREATYHFKSIEAPQIPIWPADLINGERTPPAEPRHEPVIEFEGKTYYLPFETCDTIGKFWFYSDEDLPRSTEELHQLYESTVGRGGNLLLNVPPDRTGRIGQSYVDALVELRYRIETRESNGSK